MQNNSPLWIFGYGSLMWDPGFPSDEHAVARLHGFSRSFCMRSIHHRGTEKDPGLVLALDSVVNETCEGLALRVSNGYEMQTVEYLRERELISSAYVEKTVQIETIDGRKLKAMTFVVDTKHVQYCQGVPLAEQAEIIARAIGGRGPNKEYLWNTARHLKELGIHDPHLEWLSKRVAEIDRDEG